MAATFDRLSQTTYYASRCGVTFDGMDQSAALQAVLNFGQAGPITLVIDGSCKAKGLLVYSGTTVEGLGLGTVITQATATGVADGCVFRNANFRSPYQSATIVDGNITIRNLYIDGGRRNGVSGSGSPLAAPDGSFVCPIKIYGCNGLLIENVSIYDPCSFHLHVANVFGTTIRNITVNDPQAGPDTAWGRDTDGVHVNGPADVLIDGVYGQTSDDFVGLCAIDGNTATGDAFVFGSLATVYYGAITATVRNLRPVTCPNVLRLLTGSPQGGGAIAAIDQVSVSGVRGKTWDSWIAASPFSPLGAGTIGTVLIDDVQLEYDGDGSPSETNLIGNTVGTMVLSRFAWGSDRPADHTGLLNIDSSALIGRLVLRDWVLREDSSEAGSPSPLIGVAAGTVDELILDHVNWSRNASTAQAMVAVSGGTVNVIQLAGVSANNLSNIVAVSGGTVGAIVSTGLVHRGASGGASIAQSGGTLSRARAAASDTALLASGAIASGDITNV